MNSCILITSHLNNQIKINEALKLVESLQDKDLPIIFAGNNLIPESIQEKVDWALYTKENPHVNRNIYGWRLLPNLGLGNNLCEYSLNPDYGYAHLLQTYRGFKLAESLDYDHVIHLNYDIDITPENWKKLITQIKETPNIVFGWKEEYATNVYTFLTKDFIKMADEYFHYYVNVNPPNIHRPDWFCESFFRWMVENSQVSYHKNLPSNIKVTSGISNGILNWKYDTFKSNLIRDRNEWLFYCSGHISHEIQSLEFTINDQTIKAKRIKDYQNGKYWLLPHVEGKYFFEGNLMFDSTSLKNHAWVQERK